MNNEDYEQEMNEIHKHIAANYQRILKLEDRIVKMEKKRRPWFRIPFRFRWPIVKK